MIINGSVTGLSSTTLMEARCKGVLVSETTHINMIEAQRGETNMNGSVVRVYSTTNRWADSLEISCFPGVQNLPRDFRQYMFDGLRLILNI